MLLRGYLPDLSGCSEDDAGSVIPPVCSSAWVAPDGTWHYVPDCSHVRTAAAMGTDAETLEALGYTHLSLAYRSPNAIARTASGHYTQAQADAFFDAAIRISDETHRDNFMAVVNHVVSMVA